VVNTINKWNPFFPLLVLTSHQVHAIHNIEDVNLIYEKDIIFDGTPSKDKKEAFLLKIKTIISNYNNKKENALAKVKRLAEKRLREPLTPVEEEDFFYLYRFLNDSSPDKKVLPSDFYTPQKISDLNCLLNTTMELLNELRRES
jgi:hypothetical protein